MRQKFIAIVLLLFITTACLFTAGLSVGQSPGLTITQLTSNGTAVQIAYVDLVVTIGGTIDTYNGQYRILYYTTVVASGTAQGYNVQTDFKVPVLPAENYGVTIEDVTTGENYSTPFPLATSYEVSAIVPAAPAQLQESNTVQLNVTVKGGTANRAYPLELMVVPPSEIGGNYTKALTLTANDTGANSIIVPYPDASFSPSGSTTNYMGTYEIILNATQRLTNNTFTIGFTDATQYHRGDTVNINAAGYQANQAATLTVTFNNATIFSQQVTASAQGTITASWVVPNSASIGTYRIAIASEATPSKTIADNQTFQILGFQVSFRTINIAGEPVSNLLVEVFDQGTNTTPNGTTNNNGTVTLSLERGTYDVRAYWNQVQVGQAQINVSSTDTHDVPCQLTNLKVTVQDEADRAVPAVALNLTFQYSPRTGGTQTGALIGETDVSGNYTFASIPPELAYTIAASKYNQVFSSATVTPPAQASSQTTIICPDETLTITTVDYNNAPLPNTRITLIEQVSGVFYSVITDNNGYAQLDVTFGRYLTNVYTSDDILLNKTVINALSSSQIQIRNVYYNLQVSIKVVDYFGNPISGATVQISRSGMAARQATTQGNGIATFDNVLGGNIDITAYPAGNAGSFVSQNRLVDSTATVQLKMDRYVAFGSAVIDVNLLIAIIVIVVAALLIVVVEVYRRKGGFKLRRNSA